MTPAVKLLEREKVSYTLREYAHDSAHSAKGFSYGLEAAEKLGLDPLRVYKTLVVASDQKKLAVGIVSVAAELNLKLMAKALGVKKIAMADKSLVERTSGYVVGGVSPLGQKRLLPTVIDSTALDFETVFVSGGRRGLDIELDPKMIELGYVARGFCG